MLLKIQTFDEITGTSLRPDIVLWSSSTKTVLLIELTIPWEAGVEAAWERKRLVLWGHQFGDICGVHLFRDSREASLYGEYFLLQCIKHSYTQLCVQPGDSGLLGFVYTYLSIYENGYILLAHIRK